jgi:hypothetical protein
MASLVSTQLQPLAESGVKNRHEQLQRVEWVMKLSKVLNSAFLSWNPVSSVRLNNQCDRLLSFMSVEFSGLRRKSKGVEE